MSSGARREMTGTSPGLNQAGPSHGATARRRLTTRSPDTSDDESQQERSASRPARSTFIKTTNRKTGRRHQSKLEDLETEELENYIKDKLNEKKITTKNAFSIDVIECETEIVKRSDFSQAINAEASTEGLKNHANVLDFCGKVYGHRVENTYRATTDLTEDLERAHHGKSLKGRKHKNHEDDDQQGQAETLDGLDGQDEPDVDQSKWKKGRRVKKSQRKSHVVERSALSCPETDTNANLISRYWTLIGNVQPGAMKDTWIHQGERLEDSRSLQYVMHPDLTCLQRYNGMLRNQHASALQTDQSNMKTSSKMSHSIQDEILSKAQDNFAATALQLLLRQSNKGVQLSDCVTFPKKLEKRLSMAADNVAKKQPRFRPPGMPTGGTDLERTLRQLARGGCIIESEDHDHYFAHTGMDSVSGRESLITDNVDTFEMDDLACTSPDALSERGIGAKDLDGHPVKASVDTAFSSVVDISQTQRSPTPAIEDPDPENTITGFRMPRAPSLVPSVHMQSRSGSVLPDSQPMSIDRSSRYGSVIKETNENDKRSHSISNESNMSSVGRKKIRLDLTWPEQFEWTAEDIGLSYEKVMDKGKKKTTTKEQKAGDSLVSFPVLGTISTAAMLQMLHHPASFDLNNIMHTLASQTKALHCNMQKKNWLLSESELPFPIADILRAFGQAYDEDYDKKRLLQRWQGQTNHDYNLSSDDESDQEAHEDDTEFEDGPLPGFPKLKEDEKEDEPLADSRASPTPFPLVPPCVTTDDQSGVSRETFAGTNPLLTKTHEIMEINLNDEWSDHIEPLEKLAISSQIDKTYSAIPASSSADPDVDDALGFAENIALKDLTGSGINISRMKSGVRKAYKSLRSWRSKYAAKYLQSALPYLTIQHIIQAVPLYVSGKDLCHVNASVIFSCLLHLAYERHRQHDKLDQKLYLCNSEDLKELYVMSKKEYADYTAQHPHLNALTEVFSNRLLNMTLPLSNRKSHTLNLPAVLPNKPDQTISQMSLSDMELAQTEEEEDEAHSKSMGADSSD